MLSFNPRHAKRIKLLLAGAIVFSSGIILAVFIDYRHILNENKDLISSISGDASISLENIHQTATRNGTKEWILDAGSVYYIDKNKQAVFTKPSVTFFLKIEGKIHLTAEQGKLRTDSKDIEVMDNVVMHHADYKLNTENLHYEHKGHIIFTKTPVSISGDSFSLKADTMTFDLNTSKTLFKGNIEGTFIESTKS
jgi:LPS export ABC transporter protein LptC